MPECPNKEKNLQHCNCTYEPCSRKGICCECLAYHRRNERTSGLLFSSRGGKDL